MNVSRVKNTTKNFGESIFLIEIKTPKIFKKISDLIEWFRVKAVLDIK